MVTIVLPPELEQTITELARHKGTTPELLTLHTLQREFLPSSLNTSEGTLADYLGDFIGCLDSGDIVPGGAQMSKNTGEQFADGMAQKREAKHF